MKLDKKALKQLIWEALKKQSPDSVLLEEPSTLEESSFNRVKDKVDSQPIAFVVMSADRHENSRNQNDERYTQLQSLFKKNGYPFTKIDGSWVEKDKEGNEIRVIERSLIVTDEDRADVEQSGKKLFDLAQDLSRKFSQEAFIFGDIGQNTGKRQIDAYDQTGNRVDYGGPWTTVNPIEKDAQFWSRVRGSTFVFAEIKLNENNEEVIEVEAPNSVIEAMMKANEHKGKKIKFVRRKR